MTRFQTVSFRCALLFPSVFAFDWCADAQVTVAPLVSSTVLDGDSPHLQISGLRPGEIATVRAFRQTTAYTAGSYTGIPVLAHAQVTFAADSTGRVPIDSAVAVKRHIQRGRPAGTALVRDAIAARW